MTFIPGIWIHLNLKEPFFSGKDKTYMMSTDRVNPIVVKLNLVYLCAKLNILIHSMKRCKESLSHVTFFLL